MSRPKNAEPARDSLKAYRQRAAARSQAYRDRAKVLKRPNPTQVDRAIIIALQTIWAETYAEARREGLDKREALQRPVSLARIGSAAVSHLTRLERADPQEATAMVSRRLRPERRKEPFAGGLKSGDAPVTPSLAVTNRVT
ncbi:hypothetical protein [Chenggangzhangella methanolivorans]|uniref:Uncharacterized protein n=1 Tax=Chenggangzhangella methanolivorans TaxID=1437009 RepID=A0A9E6UNV9_9HYPH|nr:hypothetical protein [Chenggangzhangella methanolivorans]QZO00694.1 hypothetical protein K6K41_03030 [Chenggangzhangella methanolivorans]